MDRIGAEFLRCVEMIESRLQRVPLVLQLPIGTEHDFRGVIDLVDMRAYVVGRSREGRGYDTIEIPATHRPRRAEWHDRLSRRSPRPTTR